MLNNIQSENVLFLDIETVSQFRNYEDLPEEIKQFWDHKAQFIARNDMETPSKLYERAGIYAEFGKIICISVAFLRDEQLRVKSYYGEDETSLLNEFAELLNKSYSRKESLLCAHNGKEFDFPYIARRMLINGINLPSILDIASSRPWDVKHIDTMELWKFGDYKSYTSLALLTSIFGITTPKEDIQGSDVGSVFWNDNNIERIVTYCQKDVIAIVQLFLRYKGQPILSEANIKFV